MSQFTGKVKYHLERFLFENYAIPKIRNERISKVVLRKYLPQNPVIIDCGSYDGSDSIQFSKLLKGAIIHSFEPVNELYARLIKNTKPYNNISCYPIALADKNGSMDFYISEGGSDASGSLLEPKDHLKDHPDTFFLNRVTVTTTTLDKWAKENAIKRVDMLWLDMQGYELKMLKASDVILRTVSVIHTEVSTRETYKGVAQYNDLRSFLEAKGFNVKLEAVPKGWDMGNVLFVRDKIV
jgi:FkbM family methyltransferase